MADDIIDCLLRLQEHDLRIADREKEAGELPAREAQLEDDLQTHRVAINQAEEELKAVKLTVKRLELEIETQRQKMARLREQQLTLKTNREFRAMEDEIRGLENVIGRIETQLLETLEVADGARAEIEARKSACALAVEQVKNEKALLSERLSKLQTDLDERRQKRQAIAGTIPEAWLPVYERLFNGRRDRVLVDVEKGICGGCHMRLPPAKTHAVRRAEALVTCDYCGRMLYSPERMN